MAQNKAILQRIHTVGLTRQITQTMKMVAASHLERKKKTATHITDYAHSLQTLLHDLAPHSQKATSHLLQKRQGNKQLLLLISTDKGMCGAFTNTTLERTIQHYKQRINQGKLLEVLPIGQKAILFCQKKNIPHLPPFDPNLSQNITSINPFTHFLLHLFQKEYQTLAVAYQPRGLNPNQDSVIIQPLLPVKLPLPATHPQEKHFIFEPHPTAIWQALLPRLFTLQLAQALTTSHAAEQKARMVAMHQATENATTLLKELKLQRNRVRQATITQEIAEINASAKLLTD